jgi:hypothetical protein
MTIHPEEITPKFNQVDNDMHEIYTMLKDISTTQKQHGKDFEGLRSDVSHMGARLIRQDTRINEISLAYMEVSEAQKEMAGTLRLHDNRFAELGAGQAELGAGQTEQGATLIRHGDKLDALAAGQAEILRALRADKDTGEKK